MPQPQILTHVCKSCETPFTFAIGDTPRKRWLVYGTCVLLTALALVAFSGEKVGGGIFMLSLVAIRVWLYLRTIFPRCPSCRSSQCVSAESPAGRRIIAGKT